MEADADHNSCMIGWDLKNAYNSRNRSEIAEAVFGTPEVKHIHRLFNLIYSHTNECILHNGKTITSWTGTMQGEVMSSVGFCLSMKHDLA